MPETEKVNSRENPWPEDRQVHTWRARAYVNQEESPVW